MKRPNNIFTKHYNNRTHLEYRNGPEIACEIEAIPSPDGYIIDKIETHPDYRNKGYAEYMLTHIVNITGMPTRTLSQNKTAKKFWQKMTERKLHQI